MPELEAVIGGAGGKNGKVGMKAHGADCGVAGTEAVLHGEGAAIPRVENVDVALLRVVGLEFTGDRDDVAVCDCEEGLVGFVHYVEKHSSGCGEAVA